MNESGSMNAVGRLGIRDTEELAEWLLYHITMQQRRRLMAERPALYARMYPVVKTDVLAQLVSDGINNDRPETEATP